MSAILSATGLSKTYQGGGGSSVEVLVDVSLDVDRGEVVAVVGASGAGKSTLLHLLGALDKPTAGELALAGKRYDDLSHAELDKLRNQQIGFVFQFHHLLREFTALENVMMPLLIRGMTESDAKARAQEGLRGVGLSDRMNHRSSELSGGEQQRCAVARALVGEPKVVLADEPSGNLDEGNSQRLHDLLFELADGSGTAMVVVTHNRQLADRANRTVALERGRLVEANSSEAGSGR
ncbi:MAG: ABC transporter ATP-binding protein [Gemmatimonadota bacterium]|nr:ABC transporter ATP-binding protein [Gemmatimonadota bacterium]